MHWTRQSGDVAKYSSLYTYKELAPLDTESFFSLNLNISDFEFSKLSVLMQSSSLNGFYVRYLCFLCRLSTGQIFVEPLIITEWDNNCCERKLSLRVVSSFV